VTIPKAEFADWMHGVQALVEAALERALPSAEHEPRRLHEAMRYAVLGGGKRVRPLLVLAAGEAVGAPRERLVPAACAVELIHAYSLVHDDLPCMDDDAMRRGRPTVHVEFDEATALLVGDALQSLAFETLAAAPLADDPAGSVEMLRTLAVASGSRGMAGGQAIDLAVVGKTLTQPELELMHIMKTGALIRAAVRLGACCGERADAAVLEQLDRYAKCVGLAFQVVDDVLDAAASSATLGKTAGKDAAQGKPTYVSILGTRAARELAQSLRRDAHAALAALGASAQRLRDLADFVVLREF
jgi:farnesyl diphosphate synthase